MGCGSSVPATARNGSIRERSSHTGEPSSTSEQQQASPGIAEHFASSPATISGGASRSNGNLPWADDDRLFSRGRSPRRISYEEGHGHGAEPVHGPGLPVSVVRESFELDRESLRRSREYLAKKRKEEPKRMIRFESESPPPSRRASLDLGGVLSKQVSDKVRNLRSSFDMGLLGRPFNNAPLPVEKQMVHISYSLPEKMRDLESHTQNRGMVRLLLRKSLTEMHQLYSYEQTKMQMLKEMHYADITEEMWTQTAAVSWRWHRNRPNKPDLGWSPMSNTQLEELKRILDSLDPKVKFVWIDYACAPQKIINEGPGMAEILRSRLYFARARRLIALPSMVVLPEQNSLRPLLSGALRNIGKMIQSSAPPHSSHVLHEVKRQLDALMEKTILCKRDYFYRAWPLAERMARAYRDEWLEHWMPLNIWFGVLGDLLWMSARGEEDRNFPWQMLSEPHRTVIEKAMNKCRVVGKRLEELSVRHSQEETLMHREHKRTAPDIDEAVASLFLAGYHAWRTPLNKQAPSIDWLCEYMTEQAQISVIATDWRDSVWSVYGSFVYKPLNFNNVYEAVTLLCKVADIDIRDTTWVQQGLMKLPSNTDARSMRRERKTRPKSPEMLVHHDSTAYKETSHITHGGAARAQQHIRVLKDLKDRLCDPKAGLAEVISAMSELKSELEDEVTNSEEGIVRLDMAEVVQQQMQKFSESPDVQLLSCLCLKPVMQTEAGTRVGRKQSLMNEMYAVLLMHSGNGPLVEEACFLMDVLAESPVIMHGLRLTLHDLLQALQTVLQKHRSTQLLQQLVMSLVVKLSKFHDLRRDAMSVVFVDDVQQAMRSHISCIPVQESCFAILCHLALGTGLPVLDGEEIDPLITLSCMEQVLATDIMSDVMGAMSCHKSSESLLKSALHAIAALADHPTLPQRGSEPLVLAMVKEAMQSHPEALDIQVLACKAITAICQFEEACHEANRIGLVPMLNSMAIREAPDKQDSFLIAEALKALKLICSVPEAKAHATLLQPGLARLMMKSRSGVIEAAAWDVMHVIKDESQKATAAC